MSLLRRFRRCVPRGDAGFSFVELVAYIGLLGILVVAAVPQIKNYRLYSVVTTMQSDARQFSSAAEAAYTISYTYPASTSTASDPAFLKRASASPGNVVAFINRGGAYQVQVKNPTKAPGKTVVWDSTLGGLQPTRTA